MFNKEFTKEAAKEVFNKTVNGIVLEKWFYLKNGITLSELDAWFYEKETEKAVAFKSESGRLVWIPKSAIAIWKQPFNKSVEIDKVQVLV